MQRAFARLAFLLALSLANGLTIPVVDVSPMLASDDPDVHLRVATEIATACREVGFFTMVGHGLSGSDFERVSTRAYEFFALPQETKLKYAPQQWNPASTMEYRGFFPANANGKEGLDLGNILPEDLAKYTRGDFQRHSPLDEATVMPADLGEAWTRDIESYYRQMLQVSKLLLRAFSIFWGYEGHHLENVLLPADRAPTVSTLRFNQYPAMNASTAQGVYGLRADEDESVPLACDTHTDGVVFTVLYQSDVGGLQVQALNRTTNEAFWVDVPVVPNALVVNTGVATERIVNGMWNATNHRVLWSGKKRLSIPFFFEASYEAVFGPLDLAVAVSSPPRAKYAKMPYGAYMMLNNRRHKEYVRGDMHSHEDEYFERQVWKHIREFRFDEIPSPVVQELKRALKDTIGVFIGSQLTELHRISAEFVKTTYGGNDSKLWFDGATVSAAGAALANALSVDALDMHDSAHNAKGHAGASIIPAAIAITKLGDPADRVDGKELLTMLAIGYEVAYRAGELLVGSSHEYHSSGAWNALGVAAMMARRLKLSQSETFHALGIAEYYAPRSPVMRVMDNPTMLKDGSGYGAMVGVSAGLLAAKGFTGSPSCLVQQQGMDLWASLGYDWHILRYHVYKRHSTCFWAQASVNGALTIREKVFTRPSIGEPRAFSRTPLDREVLDNIRQVRILTFPEALRLKLTTPETTEDAQYSLTFATVSALVNGIVGPTEVTKGIRDELVLGLMNRTRAMLHPKFVNQGVHETVVHENYAEVEVTYTDLETRATEKVASGPMFVEWDHFRGMSPPTDAELDSKFRFLAATADVPEKDAAMLLDFLDRLDQDVDDARELDDILGDMRRRGENATNGGTC